MNQQIIAISWSHHTTPLFFRDQLTLTRNEIQKNSHLFLEHYPISELAVLSTCNRIEFYVLTETIDDVLPIIKNIYNVHLKRGIDWSQSIPEIYSNFKAVQHLFRVATGMESMVLGEKQILSQVKVAHETLIQIQPYAEVLKKVFQNSIDCALSVHNDTPLSTGLTSISELAVLTAQHYFHSLDNKIVLILGSGETATLAAHHFKAVGIQHMIIANRNELTGQSLSKDTSASYLNIKHIHSKLGLCDIIVAATHSKDYLITKYQIEKNKIKHLLLFIDLSAPRNIDPSVCDIDNVVLYDLDQLDVTSANNRKENSESFSKAEQMIQNYCMETINWFQSSVFQDTELAFEEE